MKNPIEVKNVEEFQSNIYCHPEKTEQENSNLKIPRGSTILESFLENVNRHPDHPCLGTSFGENYEWKTYKQVKKQSECFGSGLLNKKIVKPGDKVGLLMKETPDNLIIRLSLMMYGLVAVPIHTGLTNYFAHDVINFSELSTLIIAEECISMLWNLQSPLLRNIIIVETKNSTENYAREVGLVMIHQYCQIFETKDENIQLYFNIDPKDVCCIIFDWDSKNKITGVIHSHAFIFGLSTSFDYNLEYKNETSWSTWSNSMITDHISLHTFQYHLLNQCGSIGFRNPENGSISDDIKKLNPTVIFSDDSFSSFFTRASLKATEYQNVNVEQNKLNKLEIGCGNLRTIIFVNFNPRFNQEDINNAVMACLESTIFSVWPLPQIGVIGELSCPNRFVDYKLEYFGNDHNFGELLVRTVIPLLGFYKDPRKTDKYIMDDGWISNSNS